MLTILNITKRKKHNKKECKRIHCLKGFLALLIQIRDLKKKCFASCIRIRILHACGSSNGSVEVSHMADPDQHPPNRSDNGVWISG